MSITCLHALLMRHPLIGLAPMRINARPEPDRSHKMGFTVFEILASKINLDFTVFAILWPWHPFCQEIIVKLISLRLLYYHKASFLLQLHLTKLSRFLEFMIDAIDRISVAVN